MDESLNIYPILCLDKPLKVDERDPSSVDDLNGRHVLIDVWGTLVAKQKNSNFSAVGTITYFMIPIPTSYPKWSRYVEIDWGYQKTSPSMEKAITGIFSEADQLEILAAVAIGVAQNANNNYPAAEHEFRHAICLLSGVKAGGSAWGAIGLDQKDLLGAVEQLEQENFSKMPPKFQASAVTGKDTNSSSNEGDCPT